MQQQKLKAKEEMEKLKLGGSQVLPKPAGTRKKINIPAPECKFVASFDRNVVPHPKLNYRSMIYKRGKMHNSKDYFNRLTLLGNNLLQSTVSLDLLCSAFAYCFS